MANHGGNKDEEHHEHPIIPFKVFFRVWVALLIFTVITVSSSYVDFGGSWNILIAMAIATAKALLVILFFMGLRYEGQENNVTFFSAFVFLAIFIGLTSSDLFYRPDTQPAPVDASELQQAAAPVDVKNLINPTPQLIAKGQQLFGQQCITCHGAQGKGDGPAAVALNPKPRNFTSAEGWKNGRSEAQIFKTVTTGLPGTPMPPFSGITPEDRFALAHYIRTLTPNPPATKPEELASLTKELGGGAAKPRISISQAMDRVSDEWEREHPTAKQ